MSTGWTRTRRAAAAILGAVLVPPSGAPFRAFEIAPAHVEQAIVVASAAATPRERKAVQVLVEEVEKRTGIRMPVVIDGKADPERPWITVDRLEALPAATRTRLSADLTPPGPEGFVLSSADDRGALRIVVAGADERGVLFGVGQLLREMGMNRGVLHVPPLHRSSTPQARLRGHQLGYRPKANSYDGWTVATWDQYIRDLAVFGANAIELIPPRSDDEATSPHFPLPQMQMMIEMSRVADSYGLDVWIWYPALDESYAAPGAIERAVEEWAGVFRQLPRVDAVMVPGGDPGDTRPRDLFPLLERQKANLLRFHPNATLWLSPQGFSAEWMDEFYGLMRQEPTWLDGIVFGPQVRDPLPVLRERLPARYPIRHYPDITHSLRSQYPVPDWDVAHAVTSGREPINPRPRDETAIFRATDRYTIGFLAYSEGCNDDVNKAIWTRLGWDRDTDPRETLSEYARYFAGHADSVRFADGLWALERNWRGPLAENDGVEETLALFREIERDGAEATRDNWRVEMALYRAYYDAYVRRRLLAEQAQQARAMDALAAAPVSGSRTALDAAEAALGSTPLDTSMAALRRTIEDLAHRLFEHARMQLSVSRYGAIGVERGATLDTVDAPLNDREWLLPRLQKVRALPDERHRLDSIAELAHWGDAPQAGDFYDDLGNPARQPHLRRHPGLPDDPSRFARGATGFGEGQGWRMSWVTHAESFYDDPLELVYDDVDPDASYMVFVVYGGDLDDRVELRLAANGTTEIHGWLPKPKKAEPMGFTVPRDATRSGRLTLEWRQKPGGGGSGRGTQVAEVWLVRERGE
jgi:hypothetical protein